MNEGSVVDASKATNSSPPGTDVASLPFPSRGDGTRVRTKIIAAKTRALDAKGAVRAVVSTEHKDRDGDVIRISGWQLDNFMEHPVLLSSHNYGHLQSQIGHWVTMDKHPKSKELVGTAQYYIGEGNGEADWGFKLAQKGMAAFSVGFIPDMSKATKLNGDDEWWPNFEFNGQELLEVSHVTIPSNPEGLQQMKGINPAIADILDELGYNGDGEAPAQVIQEFNTRQMEQLRALLSELLNDSSESILVEREEIIARWLR